MLVFDRPSIFPLILVFLPCSPLYNLPFPFDTIAYRLVAGRKTRGYARYSHLLYFSFIAFPDQPMQSTLESRSRRFPVSSLTWSSPLTRSNLVIPRQEASPVRSVSLMSFVLD